MRCIAFFLAAFFLAAGCKAPTQPDNTAASLRSDDNGAVVQVAAPTGDPATDVASIEAAVAAATPGAVIQFGRGKYQLKPSTRIFVSVAGVTLQGHSRGTTILGFDPNFSTVPAHFVLNGGGQTVRGLTFKGFPIALVFRGAEPGTPTATGGYRLENCTFSEGDTPLFFSGASDNVSTVRDNQFINVSLPFVILGKTVHFRGNRVTSPSLEDHPFGRPFNAGVLATDVGVCEKNVLEENTVVGNADGFIVFDCQNTVIRKNTFVDQIVLAEGPGGDNGSMLWAIGAGIQGSMIEENELRGSEGQGIIIEAGSNNRIMGNSFSNLRGRKLSASGFPGAAIFLGEPTTRNRVRDNEFEKVKIPIVDCGTGNIIAKGPKVVDDCPDGEAVTAERSGMLDHPKLRFLRERLQN